MKKRVSHSTNKTNISILSKMLVVIAFCLLVICGYFIWQNIQFRHRITMRSYPSNDYSNSQLSLTPTIILPSPTIPSSELLQRVKLTYNTNTFIINPGTVYKNGTNDQVPDIILTSKADGTQYLKIIDMSFLNQDVADINEVVSIIPGGAKRDTTLRNVTIDNKTYSFTRAMYGEGFPTSENCYAGGEEDADYFYMKEKKLGVVVITNKHQKGCKGTDPTVTVMPDQETLEQVLQILETLKVE